MAAVLDQLMQGFHAAFRAHLDHRSKDWLLSSSAFVPISIITVYLLVVKKWGPSFMAHRAAFKIEPIIILYNVLQIIACFYIFCKGTVLWISSGYSLLCQPVDFADSEINDEWANLVYCYYAVKISDLLDTIFFVLRKKFSHASFLHVYHHAGMVLVGYLACKLSMNGHFMTLGILNSFVHVVMYSYYLYTALFPGEKVGLTVKKSLTIVQLVQFYILVVHHGLPLLQPTCGVNRTFCIGIVIQYSFMIVLFTDFYKKAYSKPEKKAT